MVFQYCSEQILNIFLKNVHTACILGDWLPQGWYHSDRTGRLSSPTFHQMKSLRWAPLTFTEAFLKSISLQCLEKADSSTTQVFIFFKTVCMELRKKIKSGNLRCCHPDIDELHRSQCSLGWGKKCCDSSYRTISDPFKIVEAVSN